ncbi:VOC family protein [Candidatus Solirubrobacter pratensis]|uniref:VOC family protein n=1 Tax=Candidatus Solirubrobacter pratensis TaxID=1298857 RepID=UPI00041D25D5|nr:VOC family protein [Candidatus Solirubrobacter pratensis]
MGERTSYAPGTFSWAELVTSDADAAKAFYASLFGWSYDDRPIGDGQVYSMAQRDGKTVAALFAGDPPPHWNCYFSVASADESSARAKELGATILAEPFDVMDAGRMSVLTDPTGAVASLWEARRTIGAELVNVPGAITWCDLLTPDAGAAEAFYGGLFGWTFEEIPGAHGYRVIKNGDRSNGGVMPLQAAGTPPNWMPYFGHEDLERVLAEVGGLGGQVFNGPVRMPQGSIAVLGDPQGAALAVWTGEYDE